VALLLGFAPLIVFYVFVRLSVSLALWLALATAFTLGIRDFVDTGTPRVLDVAFTACFGILALYDGFIEPGMSVPWVGLVLKLSLLGVSLWSLAKRQPFAAPYVRAQIAQAQWESPLFAQSNYLLTWVWALAFAMMAAADAVTIFVPTASPIWLATLGLAAFVGALTFTWQFGVYISRRLGKAPR
jgi:hypothetical protein